MRELLEQNSYDKDKGIQAPDSLPVPEMSMEALQQALQGLQGLEGDVAVSQNQVQLNEEQEQILFDQLKKINDALWGVDHELQVNDSRGGWISGVRNAPSVTAPGMPMSGIFSKVAMHQSIYRGTIASKIQQIDKAFSLLNRDRFLSSNKNKGRWLELNKMYLEMVSGVGETYNAIPKIIKDIKDRLTYANTVLTQLPLTDVRWNKREKEGANQQKQKAGVDAISGATAPVPEKNIIMSTDETLDDLEDKLRTSDVSYNDQALEKNVPYFKNLYQQIYQKIQSDSSLTLEQRKQKVLRLACIITGRSAVYHNWEKGTPKTSTTYGRETATTAYDYDYDWFREGGNSSDGIHDKFMDPEFAQTILHTELLGADDLSNQETVFSRIINNAGIPVEHKFNVSPEKLYEMYGTNPQWNLPNPEQDEITFDPITLEQKKTGRKTLGFDKLPYKDRLQYVVLDKFLQNQTAFLKDEMQIANAGGQGPFTTVEEFADYLQTSNEGQKYEAHFDELRKQAVISTGNVVKEKLPEYLKHNNWFGKGVWSKDFPWLTDKYDKGILDVYQSIMGTGGTISDSNAMAIKEGSKIVGQIGLSLAAGFVIPGGRLAGLSTVARLAVTASVMATTNVVAHQLINRPDYVDPFEAITDVSTQFVFDAGTIFLGGVAVQKFGYGFRTFAQTFSKRGSVNWAIAGADLLGGTVAENFRQSFFMDNPPMGIWEQFKSPIGWIGFLFMIFGVKNLNKAERNNLKKNYAKLAQYVETNPQIRGLRLEFVDEFKKTQFITVGELLDNINLNKGVKLNQVSALHQTVDKIKPTVQIDAHTQRIHDNAALDDSQRPGALEKQLQEEGLLGSAETPKTLTTRQKTGINAVHDLSIKSLDEIEAVYQDKTSYEGEGAKRKLTVAAKKKIQDIIKNNNPDDPRPVVLQHTISQMQTKKKILQDIYNFDKKQAHYLVKSGGVGYTEGKNFVGSADVGIVAVEKMLDTADNQFILALGKNLDIKKVEGMILAIKKKLTQIDKDINELSKDIQQMKRDLPTKQKGKEQMDFLAQITELENKKLELQRRRDDIVEKYRTKVGYYRDHLAKLCLDRANELLKKKSTAALLDRYVDLDEKTSSQLSNAIKEIEKLEAEIKKLDDLYFGSKLETGLTDVDQSTASSIRDKKHQLDQKKQDLANRKRELIEARNKKVKKEKAITEAKKDADAVDTKIKSLEKKKDKLTDTDITDLETDINKLERKHSAVSREEVGGRSKKTTLEERIEVQKKKLAELRKTREAAKFKKKYDDELYDEYNYINRNATNRRVVPDDRIDRLEKKIEVFERDNVGKLDTQYTPTKTYKQHIAEMRQELAEIKTIRKNTSIAEVEGDMDRALGEIDHFVATQLDPAITSPSTLDLAAAKSRLALAKAKLDRLKDQIKKEGRLDDRHPISGKKREDYLLDQDQKLKDAELNIARQELYDDTTSVYAAITTLETQYRDPAQVQADSFGAANDRIGKLETELRSKGLLKEKTDPNDPTSPTYEQYIQNLKDRARAAKLNYDKFKVNKDISNPAGDGIDDRFNDYDAHPDRVDVTNDKLNELDRQLNNLESDVKKNGLTDQMRNASETYDEYIRRMRGELVKLRQKVRITKGASKITNASHDGIDDLQYNYNANRDRASVENIEALEKNLDSLAAEMRDDLDQVIPGRLETYREYIARKKTELADLKKSIKDHHANKSAAAVRDALRLYEEAVENAGMFLDEDEILEINTRKLALDRAMTDAEKKGGKERLVPEEAARIDTVNKRHDSITASKIDATQVSRDVDPVLQEYADNILLRGGDVDPTDFEHMIKLQFARMLNGLTGRTRRTKILEMISDAYVLDTLLRQSYFKNLKPEQVKLLLERNARIIQIMERYKKSVRIEYDPGDPARDIDPSYRESRSSRLKTYDLTIQEYWDGVRFFAPYSEIQAKYKGSSNATIKKFGEELGSRFLKGTLGGGTDPEKVRNEFEKTFEEAYKQLGTKKPVPGEKGSSIDTLDIVFAAADTEILSLVRRAGPIIGKMLEGLYRLVKTAITNERFGTVVTTTYGYLNGGILHATMNRFISNPLFSRRYLRRGLFIIEQILISTVTGAIQEHKEQSKIETYLESKHLKKDYDHYLAPEIVDGNKEAQKIKNRVDARLGDENPKNDEDVTLELIEYLRYVKFIEALELSGAGYDPVFKKYILDMSDFDRKRFTRDHTEQELLDPAKIQNIVANELRKDYVGKRKSEIPGRILLADGIQQKLINEAKKVVIKRNINGEKPYQELQKSDPWIQDFIDEATYRQIVLKDVHGAVSPNSTQTPGETVISSATLKIEVPVCPESIRSVLEGLVDEAGDPNEEFEYEGRVMSGHNRTPRRSS